MHELEDQLVAVGRRLAVPPSPDPVAVAAAVRGRIATRRGLGRRRLAYLGAAVLIAFAALVAGSTDVRAAIGQFFRFAGVMVEQGGATSTAPTAPTGPAVGTATVPDVAAASATVGFPVLVPAALDPPAEVAVIDGRVVSLRFDGVRLDQFDATFDPAFAKDVPDPDAVRWVRFDDVQALWLRGPHEVAYVDRDGRRRTERTAANTLVWQVGVRTLRLEGSFTLDEAIAIAQSVR